MAYIDDPQTQRANLKFIRTSMRQPMLEREVGGAEGAVVRLLQELGIDVPPSLLAAGKLAVIDRTFVSLAP